MRRGAILDNLNEPAESTYHKMELMHSSCVGTLWTGQPGLGGTQHRRPVYDQCESRLNRPTYIVRIDGYDKTPAGWFAAARDALAEVPEVVLVDGRVLLACRNEPNIETYTDSPEEYGQLYAAVKDGSVPVLFACPSLGVDGWATWLAQALAAAGQVQRGIVNLYAGNVGRVGDFIGMFGELHVGEVNSDPDVRGDARVQFLGDAFGTFERAGVRNALVFIAGGQSGGAWPDGYILSENEAQGIGNLPSGGDMDDPRIDQLLAQNALLTQAWIAFRQGQFTGAEGIDGIIVALTGKPLEFEPSYPPKA